MKFCSLIAISDYSYSSVALQIFDSIGKVFGYTMQKYLIFKRNHTIVSKTIGTQLVDARLVTNCYSIARPAGVEDTPATRFTFVHEVKIDEPL